MVPFGKGGCSNGMQSVFAPMPCGVVLFTLTSSSTSVSSHQGARTIFLASKAGTKSSHFVTVTMEASNSALARCSISFCMVSHSALTRAASSVHGTKSFFPVSRRATTACSFARSFGPISTRMGTPFCSQCEYFHPGVYESRSSTLFRTPCAVRSATILSTAAAILALSSSAILALGMGITMAWIGAIRGGSTRPLSSPWTMIITPMVRVVMPHEFCHTSFFDVSSAMYSMLNILAKFCPRQWLVPPWIPFPVAGTKASTVVVYSPPANFSFSLFTPWHTGTASRSSYTAL
mmetsp:Transcript_5592/g.15848  ORF Transcript_5592/g.15848 Transcript_5592/m.15848 type:complete len:291 (-) Transcript_5592:1409-2281(-)